MSVEHLLEWALAAAAALLGLFVKIGRDAHRDLAKEVDLCVRKDDFKEALRDLKEQNRAISHQLTRQEDKLDAIRTSVANKADRRELLEQRECQL
jgi:predicted phage gp36 major capsid-like protein